MKPAIELPTAYNPKDVEDRYYRFWEEGGYFRAEAKPGGTPFTIVMPPPNVTGKLHIGHALDNTIQDILIRWRRMQGYQTLWLPGVDHAGLATQIKVEQEIRERSGLSRHDLGREAFLERVWEWKREYGGTITRQLRRLGASADWSRERFTLDEGLSRAVRLVFERLYHKGLIYRAHYLINWCPQDQTALSDIEVEREEQQGKLYYVRYPLADGSGYIIVATTRPETILADTAVAVNPNDERYRHLIGKQAILPTVGRRLPIIGDEYIETGFGTGAMKVTPAHDPNDFEIGRRHSLDSITAIGFDARMTEAAGKYAGMDRYECRRAFVRELEENGFLVKIEDHLMNVGVCERCGTVVEPLPSTQWFVKMEPLARPAIEAVKSGEIQFVPERFSKIYLNWMENIRDWCISRQVWWGHRIPVWYCQDCGFVNVTAEEGGPKACTRCGSTHLQQDPDTLDTWFSSALWPFSTLGWPEETEDLSYFYPTNVLVTAYEIIFFWVARMIFSGLEHTGEKPFHDVFIHGLIRDAQGRKMSKSLGNGVDPLQLIDQYGADALRFTLITGVSSGNDSRWIPERAEASRNFANKIWNASRFVMMNLEGFQGSGETGSANGDAGFHGLDQAPNQAPTEEDLELADRWILGRLAAVADNVTRLMEKYELGEAARALYDFIWDEYCDWYIEAVKPRLYNKEVAGEKARRTAQWTLWTTLEQTLRLLHPFMPFLTEAIWQSLPHEGEALILAPWPGGVGMAHGSAGKRVEDKRVEGERADRSRANRAALATLTGGFDQDVDDFTSLVEVIKAVRNLRAEMNVPAGKKAEVILVAGSPEAERLAERGQSYVRHLAKVSSLDIRTGGAGGKPEQAGAAVAGGLEIYLPLKGLIDLDKERERLQKEKAGTALELERLSAKLANPGFLAKAPGEVVAKDKARAEELKGKLEVLDQRLALLG
ncbi:MAG: valine--tRNA ligase [Firmicutes bacterium]|nr:valine--tRNA ligase [Bacillota bacterium]